MEVMESFDSKIIDIRFDTRYPDRIKDILMLRMKLFLKLFLISVTCDAIIIIGFSYGFRSGTTDMEIAVLEVLKYIIPVLVLLVPFRVFFLETNGGIKREVHIEIFEKEKKKYVLKMTGKKKYDYLLEDEIKTMGKDDRFIDIMTVSNKEICVPYHARLIGNVKELEELVEVINERDSSKSDGGK
jgi:hypothetical protein